MSSVTHDTSRGATHGGARTAPGLIFALTSAASFGLSGTLASGLMAAGWSAAAAVAVRVLVAGVVLAPFAARALRGHWGRLRRSLGLVVAYGLVPVAGTQLAYFNAVAHLQVGVALLIEYTAPVLVVAWLWARHRQRPGVTTVAGAAIGIAGLLLVLDVGTGGGLDPVGVAWALAAMVGGACYFVLSSGEAGGLPATALAAAGLLLGGLALLLAGAVGVVPFAVSAAPVAFTGVVVPWWVAVLTLGVVTAAVAYVTGIAAARALGSRLASFVALLEVLAALAFAWLLLGEVPGGVQLVGGALVLAGVAIVKLGEPRSRPVTEPGLASPAEPLPLAAGSGGHRYRRGVSDDGTGDPR